MSGDITCDQLVAIGIASFDMRSGTKVLKSMIFSEKLIVDHFDHLIKLTLGNIHRQQIETLIDISMSYIEVPLYGVTLLAGTFFAESYYTVDLIFDSSLIPNDPFVCDVINQWCHQLAVATQYRILHRGERAPIEDLESKSFMQQIHRIRSEIAQYFSSSITFRPPFRILSSESAFFATALSSHIQTQMNTIVEVGSNDPASPNYTSPSEIQRFVSFLAHFTLPTQLEHSCKEPIPSPICGFFLQVVDRQTLPIEDILISFPKQVTWIRIPENQVFQTPLPDQQCQSYTDCYPLSISRKSDYDSKKRLKSFRNTYKVLPILQPLPWATRWVYQIIGNAINYELVCEKKLDITISAVQVFLNLIHNKINRSRGKKIQVNEVESILKMMSINKDEISLIVSMAGVFDPLLISKIAPLK